MDGPAMRSAWSELEEVHTEVQRVRSRLLDLERRLARLEVRLELEGAEPPMGVPLRPFKITRRRRLARAKIPFSPGPRPLS